MAWHPDGQQIFVWFGGGIHAVDLQGGQPRRIPFRAPVRRELTETLRFPTDVPDGTFVLGHTAGRVAHQPEYLHEALGDLWLGEGDAARNLTSSTDHETSPVYDPETATVYYASWTDADHGAVYALRTKTGERERLTQIASHTAAWRCRATARGWRTCAGPAPCSRGCCSPTKRDSSSSFARRIASRSSPASAAESSNTRISRRKFHRTSCSVPTATRCSFTEFVDDELVLKRIAIDGTDERVLYQFRHGVEAALSPNLEWIALREYHRSFLTPFRPTGRPITVSAFDRRGLTLRVDAEDGGYFSWSRDGSSSDGRAQQRSTKRTSRRSWVRTNVAASLPDSAPHPRPSGESAASRVQQRVAPICRGSSGSTSRIRRWR